MGKSGIIQKPQLSTDLVENLGVKDKESFEENGWILFENYSSGFRIQISSQNCAVSLSFPMDEKKMLLYISFETLSCNIAIN